MEFDYDLLLQTWLSDAEEHLTGLEDLLVALERGSAPEDVFDAVFRLLHTMKGDAASMGFEPVASFVHAMEDLVDALRKGRVGADPSVVGGLLRGVDVLREMTGQAGTAPLPLGAGHRSLMRELATLAGRPPAPEALEPSAPAAEPNGGARQPRRGETLRVEVAKLDRMLGILGEIASARARHREALGAAAFEAVDVGADIDRLYLELQALVLRLRMVPLQATFRHFERVVRELGRTCGKTVEIETEGGEVEIDSRVAEALREPLTHLVRNAVDHGIEPPADRVRASKPPGGTVRMRARHEASHVTLELSDDGAGLDRERIRARAAELGLLTDPDLDDDGLFGMIFAPSFSTAAEVSELSGRGVGMDAVRTAVEAVGGTIGVESQPGRGTLFRIRLPHTLSRGFAVKVGGETYVVPLEAVSECCSEPNDADWREGRAVTDLNGEALPCLMAPVVFDAEARSDRRRSMVVLHHDGLRLGLVVDGIRGDCQVAAQPLGRLLENSAALAGSAILEDGTVALLVELSELVRIAVRR